jgi:hypothetical protein
MIDPNEARAALRDLNLFLSWMSAIVLVAYRLVAVGILSAG